MLSPIVANQQKLVNTRKLSIHNICCRFSQVKANFMKGLLAQISLQIFVLLHDCCVFFFYIPPTHRHRHHHEILNTVCSASKHTESTEREKRITFPYSWYVVRTAGIFPMWIYIYISFCSSLAIFVRDTWKSFPSDFTIMSKRIGEVENSLPLVRLLQVCTRKSTADFGEPTTLSLLRVFPVPSNMHTQFPVRHGIVIVSSSWHSIQWWNYEKSRLSTGGCCRMPLGCCFSTSAVATTASVSTLQLQQTLQIIKNSQITKTFYARPRNLKIQHNCRLFSVVCCSR